ncbi:hypothetical protein [Acinetobacter dispersus]|uniref:hypothetical protein n=1 Tax=Acinetobacter dispersus TaxID=70348 RepID=UPI001F4B5BCE|nr:hypothetical protein [Acinetobacter dispersus]MCH7392433.1 hypothetical protein [Acinetobacter dispersus]
MMREQFEQSIKVSPSYQKLVFQHGERLFIFEDGQYKIASVQLAWEIFQRCRSDYEHLLGKYRATKQLQYSTSEHNTRLHRTLLFVKEHFWMNDLGESMPRVYEQITECLEDQPRKVHNASCTYQFELAFLHLKDTPELRKIYWSALGQLQFDSNDQVITPELEQCTCCEGMSK